DRAADQHEEHRHHDDELDERGAGAGCEPSSIASHGDAHWTSDTVNKRLPPYDEQLLLENPIDALLLTTTCFATAIRQLLLLPPPSSSPPEPLAELNVSVAEGKYSVPRRERLDDSPPPALLNVTFDGALPHIAMP